MKFNKFNNSLPNGLHDAHISAISVDYVGRSIEILIQIWTGNIESIDIPKREEYRNAKISITNFQYLIMEKPDKNYEYNKKQALWIDAGELKELKIKPELPEVSNDIFQIWIFVREWNSFIYIAAEEIDIIWNKSVVSGKS